MLQGASVIVSVERNYFIEISSEAWFSCVSQAALDLDLEEGRLFFRPAQVSPFPLFVFAEDIPTV